MYVYLDASHKLNSRISLESKSLYFVTLFSRRYIFLWYVEGLRGGWWPICELCNAIIIARIIAHIHFKRWWIWGKNFQFTFIYIVLFTVDPMIKAQHWDYTVALACKLQCTNVIDAQLHLMQYAPITSVQSLAWEKIKHLNSAVCRMGKWCLLFLM